MISVPSDVGNSPATIIQFVSPGHWSAATRQPHVDQSSFSLYRKMHSQKATQKLQTPSAVSNTAEVPVSIINRQSTSAGRDSRLLMLHRKCPNPLMCVGAANTSQPLLPVSVPVPFVGCSPVVCQPLPCKPRLRPVASLQEAAEINVVGNAVRDSDADASLPLRLSAKQKQLRRKVYTSHSANGRSQGKPTSSDGDLQGKARPTDIYIPTASGSIHAKSLSGSRKLTDRAEHDMSAIQQNAYYIDVVLQDGRLKMEHVENPRPLPPRHIVSADDDDDEISKSSRGHLHCRPDSVSKRRCVTDSELRSSRHLIYKQPPNIGRSNSLFMPQPISSSQRVFSGDSEQTFHRVAAQSKRNPNIVGNSRTVCVDGGALRRHGSGQHVLNSAEKLQRRQVTLKKAISDVDRKILRDDRYSDRHMFSENPQAFLPCDDSSDYTESYSIHDKYVTFTLMLTL